MRQFSRFHHPRNIPVVLQNADLLTRVDMALIRVIAVEQNTATRFRSQALPETQTGRSARKDAWSIPPDGIESPPISVTTPVVAANAALSPLIDKFPERGDQGKSSETRCPGQEYRPAPTPRCFSA